MGNILELQQADLVAMARAYADAGAEMVLTNTFGGNRFTLERYGLQQRVRDVNREAARLAREGVPSARRLGI